ncbi:MAG: cyclase family protein [Anaerolineae bacterium]|nr:cyclase family protein [Anaerolineae bacterium]
MALVDLTGTLEPGMWRYDHIPPVEIALVSTIEEAGSEAHAFRFATISGTYLETAAHLFHGQPTIDQIPPERFLCDAALLRLGELAPAQAIGVADLERAAQGVDIAPGDALIVDTGWERMWNAPTFIVDSPYYTMDAMRWIVARGVSILGGNMPCYDNPRGGAGVNKVLFGSGALILAPLVNLASLTGARFRLMAFPLKVRGVCGTPCRAIAAYG